jgi:hypothetical protein
MQQITILQSEFLNNIVESVFQRKETTFSQEALGYTRDDFEATLRHYRAELRRTLGTLREVAYLPQPPDSEGNEVWSAGQVACHLLRAASEVGIKDMRSFLGLSSAATEYDRASLPEGEICTRAEALTLLDAADRDLDAARRRPARRGQARTGADAQEAAERVTADINARGTLLGSRRAAAASE